MAKSKMTITMTEALDRMHKAETDQRALDRELNLVRGMMQQLQTDIRTITKQMEDLEKPVPMLLWCPLCHFRHVDKGEFATKAHKSHACQKCGMVWRPAVRPTVGVQHLPGFRDES